MTDGSVLASVPSWENESPVAVGHALHEDVLLSLFCYRACHLTPTSVVSSKCDPQLNTIPFLKKILINAVFFPVLLFWGYFSTCPKWVPRAAAGESSCPSSPDAKEGRLHCVKLFNEITSITYSEFLFQAWLISI